MVLLGTRLRSTSLPRTPGRSLRRSDEPARRFDDGAAPARSPSLLLGGWEAELRRCRNPGSREREDHREQLAGCEGGVDVSGRLRLGDRAHLLLDRLLDCFDALGAVGRLEGVPLLPARFDSRQPAGRGGAAAGSRSTIDQLASCISALRRPIGLCAPHSLRDKALTACSLDDSFSRAWDPPAHA